MSKSPTEPTNAAERADLPAGERWTLLASERRRLVLDVLAGQTAAVELEELAAGIAAREEGTEATDEEAIDRVVTSLHHSHLPKLADAGVLDYDPEAHLIDSEGIPTRLEPAHPSPGQLDWFSAFEDRHRRLALEVLAQNGRTSLDELSTALADADSQSADASADTIALRLHHDHLPRLDDMGFVHYDPDDHVVAATERTSEQIGDFLDVAPTA